MPGFKVICVFMPLILLSWINTRAQGWELAMEHDGIKVYTRPEPGSSFKAFKGEVLLDASVEDICELLEDVEKFDEWDEDVAEIRVLSQEKAKFVNYYVKYDTPWPAQDRDLCVSAWFSKESGSGKILLESSSRPELVAIDEDYIRIIEYHQKWIIEPVSNGNVHLTVEGFADPAGSIPAWIANMAITKTPKNMLISIREYLASH